MTYSNHIQQQENMTEQEFETYWKQHRDEILRHDKDYTDAKENFKVHSGADLILFGLPVVAGIVFMNNVRIGNELLLWLLSAAVTVLVYAVCVWVKSMISGTGSPDEVERRVKERVKAEKTGK